MAIKSWLDIPADSHFSIANIPFGIISTSSSPEKRPAIAIGDHVLDLAAFTAGNGFQGLAFIQPYYSAVFSQPTLNAFAALGRGMHQVVREYLQDVFSESTTYPDALKNNKELQGKALLPRKEVKTHLPMQIGDYTDFFAGQNHAFNAGTIFRGPVNALQPNYKHIPVAYHSRASSVVVSGTRIRRPLGQVLLDPTAEPKTPTFTACRKLDIELELGAFLCSGNQMGEPIPIQKAEENLFGLVLLNDWSARDIQQWEAVPLGPFNAKNFASSISPWVVLADALEPFKTKGIENTVEVQSYLKEKTKENVFDIKLEVDITTPNGETTTVSRTNASNLLWSFPQMIAHHTIGGCPLNTGDLLGSGTISGTSPDSLGSFLELTKGGKEDVMLAGMDVRKFLKDGDTITIRGACGESGALVGFGECVGTIESAIHPESFLES